MKKRIFAIGVVFLFVVAILFSGGQKQVEQKQPGVIVGEWTWEKAAAPYEGQTVYVLLQSGPATDATASMIPEFEKMTGIKVVLETLDRRAMNTREEIELSTQGVCAYDVTHLSPEKRVRYSRAGWVLPLNDLIANPNLTSPQYDFEDFFAPYVDCLKISNYIYGIPFTGEAAHLYYRKDIFNNYGLDAPPDTWDEVEEISKKIYTKEIPAFATRAVRGQGLNMYTWVTFLKAYGGDFFTSSFVPIVNSPEAIEAVEVYARLLNKYGPFGIAEYDHWAVNTDFAQGKAAIVFSASAWGASVFSDPSKCKVIDSWEAAIVPAGPKGRFSELWAHGLMIPSSSAKKEAAWLFIQWFTNKKTMLDRSLKEGGDGSIPRASVFANPDFLKRYNRGNWANIIKQVGLEMAAELRPNWLPQWMEVGDRIGAAVQEVIAEQASAKDAMTRANNDVAGIMKEAGY